MEKFWTQVEHAKLSAADGFSDMLDIAMDVLKRMPQPVSMVSGPMTTGGASFEENLKKFGKVIEKLDKEGKTIFNQLPFQNIMLRLYNAWTGPGYCMPLLTDFYQPIFKSGLVKTVYFIPGWEKSFGASWEHEQAKELGIERVYLSDEFMADL
ncbi:MAG: DUF4406 domain-containing protein [Candidatus Taylorbacteria bacterium]|nr:DUF4406 domain-containing protein [Candidatus Taylorbacteria bacterium]